MERKFTDPGVTETLKRFGFLPGNYTKVVVSWGWDEDVPPAARRAGVELWDFRDILKEISEKSREYRTYFTDDTMRTLQLMAMATKS